MSDSTESSAYFYRVISLVVDVGTETLRDIFYSKVPKSDVVTLFAKPEVQAEFKRLKGKSVLTQVQYDKVTNNPEPDTYDISLLTTLLTNKKICKLLIPTGQRASASSPFGTSLEADLLCLRETRNEIIAHCSKAQLEVHEYKKIWGRVENVLVSIAKHVSAEEEVKIKDLIRNVEKRELQPLHEREKKLLQEFIEWQKEDNKKYEEKLTDVLDSLKTLTLKVDSISNSKDEPDAARSSITLEDTLSSIQSQVNSLAQSLGCIAKQDDVMQIQQNMRQMQNNVKAISDLMALLKQTVDASNRNLAELSKNAQTSASVGGQRGQYTPDRPKKPKITNPHAMSDREIDALSRKIGSEWESLRIHLDFTEAQGQALKWAFNDSIQIRIYQMLKAWHDVVVECGENPRMLLAAAFVNASTNYRMAYEIVPKQQFNARALAKHATVERIQEITFSKTGYDQGDVFYERPGSGGAYRPGGPGSFNIYGGEVRLGGRLDIQHPHPSYVATDRPDASFSGDNGSGSFNVYGGKVEIPHVVMGPPSQGNVPSYNSMTAAQNYSSIAAVRGEVQVVPDLGRTQPTSFQHSGQPFKKENDDTLSQSMVGALGEQMKSVGALIHCGKIIGTVFRVGSKFVMTASHVISIVLDPHNTGCPDVNRLESDETFINFNESVISPAVALYKVKKEFIENKQLDVAVLEISQQTLSGLPMKMNLCVKEVSEVGVANVSLIGYGHPGGIRKHLDPKCKLVPANSQRIQSAQAYAQQNLQFFRSVVLENGGNPDIVDIGYQGYDNPCRLLFDCYMEQGASGAPALTNNNERSVQVVGLLTHGLPEFYFMLPDYVKSNFHNIYRLESGTKMKYIYEWVRDTQPEHIVKDIFNM